MLKGARSVRGRPASAASLLPTAGSFVWFGAFAGAWAVAAVDVERTFDLSDAELGALLAVGIIAAAGVNAVGGVLTDRWGAGVALARALVLWGVLLAAEAASPRFALFAIAFVLATAGGGLVDVVINILAAARLGSRPGHLVRFHGLFNAGAVLGAAMTGISLHAGASWRVAWAVIAVVAVLLGLVSFRFREETTPASEHPSMVRSLLALRHEGLIVFAAVFAAAAMVEGGIATWGVLYFRADLGLGVLAGVSAYVIGQTLSTVTRMVGGPAIGGLGAARGVALGGAVATVGIGLEALAANAAAAAAGLALASVGITVVWPLLLAEVSVGARHPSVAIGGITAAGYLGMVAGPAIVGALSGLFDLRVGLLVLAGASLFVTFVPARVGGPAPDAGDPVEPTV